MTCGGELRATYNPLSRASVECRLSAGHGHMSGGKIADTGALRGLRPV